MVRPLGLPVGSVRAVLLLCLGVRAVADLTMTPHQVAPWLIVALLIAAASYFAARAAGGGSEGGRQRAPLGLPAGTIRLLFLVLLAYGAWRWFQHHPGAIGGVAVAWVLAAYVIGLLVRLIMRSRRGHEEAAATFFEHLLALVTLLAAGGLVWLAFRTGTNAEPWLEPFLGAIVVHYFATR